MLKKNKNPWINFVGIGVPRSSTTWLAQCLGEHPEIYVPANKEFNFFTKQKSLKRKSLYEKEGLKGYYSRFGNTKGLKCGEFTPTYFYDKETAKILKKHFPKMKVILILRDPIKRAISEYNYYKNYGIMKNFKALSKERSYYSTFLKEWMNVFGKANIKIILYEEILENPNKVLKELFTFLRVRSDFVPPSLYKKINIQGGPSSKLLLKIQILIPKLTNILRERGLNKLLRMLRKIQIHKLWWFIWRTNHKPTNKKTEKIFTKEELKNYNKDILKTGKIIKRDLRGWLR